jgi:adenosylcobinamide-phosphate synthase
MWIDSPFAAWAAVIALLFAFCLDRWFGEPVARWHPVGWMRSYVRWIAGRPGLWLGGAVVAASLAWLLQWVLLHLNEAVAGLLLGALLKPMLAWRALRAEMVPAAGPPGPGLPPKLNDAVVAPVFWFLVAGLPGAVVYRFASTAQAASTGAALARDALAWFPGRVTAAVFAALGRGARIAEHAVAVVLAWTCLVMFLLSLRPW